MVVKEVKRICPACGKKSLVKTEKEFACSNCNFINSSEILDNLKQPPALIQIKEINEESRKALVELGKPKKISRQSGKVKSVKSYKLLSKDKKIIKELLSRPEGLRVEVIEKLTSLPNRTIYRRLNRLKKEGLVLNMYPIWKLVNGQVELCQSLLSSNKIFELHNLGYVLRLMNTPDWWLKRKPRIERIKGWQFTNNDFGKNNRNPYQQIMNENFVVQTYPESIIIIARKRYYSNDPYEVIQEGMCDVLDLISYLEEQLRFKFLPDGVPCIELRANDFNRVKDVLAEHCKKDGRRFLVETPKGKLWVDYSEPFGKEANTPDIQHKLEKVNEDIIMKESLLPSELTAKIKENEQKFLENQAIFSDQIRELSEGQKISSEMQIRTSQVLKQISDNMIFMLEEFKKLKEK